MRIWNIQWGILAVVLLTVACESKSGGQAADNDTDSSTDTDTGSDADTDADTDTSAVESCNFDYDAQFATFAAMDGPGTVPPGTIENQAPSGWTAHIEPPAPNTYVIPAGKGGGKADLVLPGYEDNMPMFERGLDWSEDTRCYELPYGAHLLTQDQAYDMYREIAEQTTGISMDTEPEVRTVLGVRGAYPGTFQWHGNTPDLFNDTLVLMWVDGDGFKHVREFAVHTDVGNYYFGFESSSSLRPNRRYHYINGWHGSTPYNALHVDEIWYRVRNDTNANGHWDDDRNGWLPPDGDDYFREGSGHNIHMGSVSAPLGSAHVNVWSAGCQVIPGMASWVEFINAAWTEEGDHVNYFLVDVRDIHPPVWYPCEPDGSHECPFEIELPADEEGDTSTATADEFDVYNCSMIDESGNEIVYVFTTDEEGTLNVVVDCVVPVDIDIHLLEGDDANACLARGHESFTYDITPGRYLVVADTFVSGADEFAGEFSLSVWIE
jgi:hypothetical protein